MADTTGGSPALLRPAFRTRRASVGSRLRTCNAREAGTTGSAAPARSAYAGDGLVAGDRRWTPRSLSRGSSGPSPWEAAARFHAIGERFRWPSSLVASIGACRFACQTSSRERVSRAVHRGIERLDAAARDLHVESVARARDARSCLWPVAAPGGDGER